MTQQPTILITGGTGFADSHLVEALLANKQANIHVTSYGKDSGLVSTLLPQAQVHTLDLTDFSATKKLLSKLKPDQIYHLAALAGVGDSFDNLKKVLDLNTQIQLSLLSAVKECCSQARVLSIGSALEYQPQTKPLSETDQLGPVSPYGVSKVTQDMLSYAFFRQDNLQIIRTRSFNHIGERQTSGFVVADFCQQIVKLEQSHHETTTHASTMLVGNLSAIRDFTDVKDTVKAYITLMEKGVVGDVYNVGSGQGYSIQFILDTLLSFAKVNIKTEGDPKKNRPIDVPKVVAKIDKIKKLGWQPTVPIKDTLIRTLEYYRQAS